MLSGVTLNGHIGYGTEVDYCDGVPCPMLLQDQPVPMKDLLAIKLLMGTLSEMNLEDSVNFALMVIIVTNICKGELQDGNIQHSLWYFLLCMSENM